jgi:hypothetical protein
MEAANRILSPSPRSPFVRGALSSLFWAVVFGLAYTQAPLYYSNQNQYFLHGLAEGGLGDLEHDWLANTADPTPVFSALVAITYRWLHPAFFYLYYLLILGLYAWSMFTLFKLLLPRPPSALAQWLFAVLFVAVHAGIFRLLSQRWFGIDYPYYVQGGVAGQYILRFGLQPSVSGVFLVTAVVAFLRDRPYQTAVLTALAPIIHPTYLLPAGLLTAAFLFVLAFERQPRRAIRTGGLILLLVLPIILDTLIRFGPSDATTFAEAQRLLARFRIPHHSDYRHWGDHIAMLQGAWIVLGMALLFGRRLFWVLAPIFLVSLALSVIQFALDSDTLALIFPWRTTAILVPLSTTIVLARVVQLLEPRLETATVGQAFGMRIVFALVLAGLVAAGIVMMAFNLGYPNTSDELAMLEYVRQHRQPGDVYLVPVNVPKGEPTSRGIVATDFTPPPRPDQAGLIAVDLQRFRLYTGAAIYVDFKSVPYKDREVLEWHRRLLWAQAAYGIHDWDQGDLVSDAVRHGITHVVAAADHDVQSRRFEEVYRDKYYSVHRILP